MCPRTRSEDSLRNDMEYKPPLYGALGVVGGTATAVEPHVGDGLVPSRANAGAGLPDAGDRTPTRARVASPLCVDGLQNPWRRQRQVRNTESQLVAYRI